MAPNLRVRGLFGSRDAMLESIFSWDGDFNWPTCASSNRKVDDVTQEVLVEEPPTQ